MSKNLAKDEVDLLEVFLVIWKKKWQVIFVTVVCLILMFVNVSIKKPEKINAITEIRPISVYDAAKYKIYNSVINSIRPYYVSESLDKVTTESVDEISKQYKILNTQVQNLEINNIDKMFLLNLFIDRLNEKSNLIDAIKKFNLIKRKDYRDKLEYEDAVIELASSIKLIRDDNGKNFISFQSFNLENWEGFLKFIEKETNLEIQRKISDMFNNYINYVEAIKLYKIEDIQTQLSVTQNEREKIALEKEKNILIANKYIERIKDIFEGSPISKLENFYAAKIIYNQTVYELGDDKKSVKTIFLVTGICGIILGIFFVLIANAIQNRR